jgi:hypothetical protein
VSSLLCSDGKVPAPQELPALHEPFVPVPEIEQLPGIPVDIQRPTDFPSESQIPITVTAPEDEHPPPTTLPPAPVPPPTPLPPRTRRVSVSTQKRKNSVHDIIT